MHTFNRIYIIPVSIFISTSIIRSNISNSNELNKIRISITKINFTITIAKRIGGHFYNIPCIDGIGSCTYDLCAFIKHAIPAPYPNGTCQEPFSTYGIPCTCPIAPSNITLPPTLLTITASLVPWIEDGTFKIKTTVDNTTHRLFCVEGQVDLVTKPTN